MRKTYTVRQGEFNEATSQHPVFTRGTFYSLSDARKFYDQIRADTSWSNSDYVYTEVIQMSNGSSPLQFDYYLQRVQ